MPKKKADVVKAEFNAKFAQVAVAKLAEIERRYPEDPDMELVAMVRSAITAGLLNFMRGD